MNDLEITDIDSQIKLNRLSIGKSLKLIRETRGYSQEQLAEMMQVNRSTIVKIENGKFGITVDFLAKASIMLNYEFKVIER